MFLIKCSLIVAGCMLPQALAATKCQDAANMPNNTEKLIQTGLTITDDQGNVNYPIDVNRPIVLSVTANNTGVQYNQLYVDVKLSYWGNPLGGDCHWVTIPTLGLLNNIDGCKIAGNCPLKPGPVSFKQQLDLGPFSSIISQLGGGVVYQLGIHAKNGDVSSRPEISCVQAQGLMAKKS